MCVCAQDWNENIFTMQVECIFMTVSVRLSQTYFWMDFNFSTMEKCESVFITIYICACMYKYHISMAVALPWLYGDLWTVSCWLTIVGSYNTLQYFAIQFGPPSTCIENPVKLEVFYWCPLNIHTNTGILKGLLYIS